MNVQVHTYMNKEQAQSPFQLAVSICLHSSLRNRHAGWVQRKGREISREKRVCLSELTHCPGCWRRWVKANIILNQPASGHCVPPFAHSHFLGTCGDLLHWAALLVLPQRGLLGKLSLPCWYAGQWCTLPSLKSVAHTDETLTFSETEKEEDVHSIKVQAYSNEKTKKPSQFTGPFSYGLFKSYFQRSSGPLINLWLSRCK